MRFLLSALALAGVLGMAWFQQVGAEELTHTKDTLDTVKQNLKDGKAVLVDVREQKEWDDGHIAGALFMPKSKLDVDKEAAELAKKATGRTVYILDEPTTGLHFADIHKLLEVLMKLRDSGNTLIIIEHNLEVIKCADWVLDLGPEGGFGGGQIVAEGPPEEVAKAPGSHTGRYLQRLLK